MTQFHDRGCGRETESPPQKIDFKFYLLNMALQRTETQYGLWNGKPMTYSAEPFTNEEKMINELIMAKRFRGMTLTPSAEENYKNEVAEILTRWGYSSMVNSYLLSKLL